MKALRTPDARFEGLRSILTLARLGRSTRSHGRGKKPREGLAGVGMGASMDLSQAEIDAYDSPFPDASYQAGVLVFPLVIQPEKLIPDGLALFNGAWRVLEK